jgi:hypothetical protein
MRNFAIYLILNTLSIFFATNAFAQFSLNINSSSPKTPCRDFASQNLKDYWDFSNGEDFPSNIFPQQIINVTDLKFENGIVSFKSTTNDPHLTLTTIQSPGSIAVPDFVRYGSVFPIDTSRYKSMSVRMYTDQDSTLQIYWANADSFAITQPIDTYAGQWRTYTVNLATSALSDSNGPNAAWLASPKTQIRLDPSHKSGANVLIDWVQLTDDPANCENIAVDFQGVSDTAAAVVLDNDENIDNGVDGFIVDSLQTGVQKSVSFNTSTLSPKTYKAYGFSHTDFATLWGNPWDMKDSRDIISSEIYNLSNSRFENQKFCARTSNSDGNFYLTLPRKEPINAAIFKYLTVKLEVANPNSVTVSNVQFFDKNRTFLGNENDVTYDSINNIVEFNLTNLSSWRNSIYYLRIQPTTTSGVDFCVDWIALTTSPLSSYQEPTTPPVVSAVNQATVESPETLNLIQPDIKGGRDCPTHDLGNPWVMDGLNDIQGLSNVEQAQLRVYNTVIDSRGGSRVGDFFRGLATVGSDDPKVHPLLFSSSINADKCVNFCYSLILNRDYKQFHSVARVTYLNTLGQPQDGDDVINPDRWSESEVCLYMPELKQEPDLDPSKQHPWNGNINFLSLDPHEDRDGNEFFIDYIELRENHKASDKFTIVVDANLNSEVELYYSLNKPFSQELLPSGANLITKLPSARSSNVFLWNTSGLAAARYYISARINPTKAFSVVKNSQNFVEVTRNFSDTVPPIHIIDSPKNNQRVSGNVAVAGAVFDNIRHAVSEVYIDDIFQQQFTPNLYHRQARLEYASTAPDKPGFYFNVNLDSFADGNHTLKIVSYDTAGNTQTYTATIVKGAQSDPEPTYPDPNASPINYQSQNQSISVNVSNNEVTLSANGYDGCVSTAVLASKTSDLSEMVTLFNGRGSLSRTAKDVTQWIASARSVTSEHGKNRRGIRPLDLTDNEIIRIDGAVCGFVDNSWAVGRILKNGKFLALAAQVKRVRAKIKKTKNPLQKAKLAKNITKLNKLIKKGRKACKKLSPPPTTSDRISEDGVIYFKAQCSGSLTSNVASLDFSTKINNPQKTTPFETAILQELQSKLSQ